MFNNLEFSYDGVNSSLMGVYIVSVEDGLKENPFGYIRKITEEKIPYRDLPFFYGTEKECLTLKITIAKLDDNDRLWTFDERKKIIDWFYQETYKPFISYDNPDIVYYCMPIESARFDTGIYSGYATITLRCNAPYPFTPVYLYNYAVTGSFDFDIENLSNVNRYYFPYVEFENIGTSTECKIVNLTDGGRETLIINLGVGEKIYIDNQLKQILTSNTGMYKLSDFNKNWLRLVKGVNQIRVIGDVNISVKCIFPISI